jgi:hypothetical protein
MAVTSLLNSVIDRRDREALCVNHLVGNEWTRSLNVEVFGAG